jgi:galactonate dehydratase
MKIRSLELFKIPPRLLFLKITTDEGLVGWGEPVVEGRADTVGAAVKEMSEYLIGKESFEIEDTWQLLYRGGFYRGGPVLTSALSGIDQALWDIKGKALGVPIYELLGGKVRDKMRVYSWIGGGTPEELAKQAAEKVRAGYTALKMNAVEQMEWIDSAEKIQLAATKMAAVREAVGYGVGIGIDFHGRVHKGMSKVLIKELEAYKPLFFEEPVLPENNEALMELARITSVPIATGERMFTRWGFKSVLCQGGVDIVQPDLSHCGGISEAHKIASMAEAFDVAVAPHCPLGPITFAASLQIDFCSPNAFIQEQVLDLHSSQNSEQLRYLKDPGIFRFVDGFVERPRLPGLGIEINEEYVKEMSLIGHQWHTPVWRNTDGSITEW